ncbi:MAG: ABC transporter substrate-binding protein [Chloroflexota bacterium]
MIRPSRRQFAQGVGVASIAFLAGCAGLGGPFSASPPAARVRRVVYLSGGANVSSDLMNVFRLGLSDLGYVDGRDIVIEERYVSGDNQVAEFAAELARLQPEVIVVPAAAVARAVQAATTTIPIVSVGQTDLLALGLTDSLARPSGNVTGLSTPSLGSKQLQLLQEAVPRLSRVANLEDINIPVSHEPYEVAARALGLEILFVGVAGPDDLEPAFSAAMRERADGLIVTGGPFIQQSAEPRIAGLALQRQLPSMWQRSEPVRNGGLMAYGANRADLFRRAATYVDKILKGARPTELPIEQPTRFDFAINLRTAQALGLTIPPSVLAQATEVIQ